MDQKLALFLDKIKHMKVNEMNSIPFTTVRPGHKRFKVLVVKIVFFVLGRALQSVSRFDPVIKEELKEWPDNLSIMYKVQPFGPEMMICKENGQLRKRPSSEKEATMIIFLKNIEYSFLLMTTQKGTVQAFLESAAYLKGDVPIAMSLIRILDRVQYYLFPGIIAKRVVKRLPNISLTSRYSGRLRLYLLGIPFGL
ncbi:MAG: hypothetical protein KAT16_01495 [Candidatus Heimdallarchaeota archaeon]|nr:hypothetical protein [Candidatus Heimdallarchaeota archaeon]